MTTPTNPPSLDPLTEEWGERLSAYLDGELSAEEAAEVAHRLETEPALRALADELRSVTAACQSASAVPVGADLTDAVLAEARRRQASGDDGRVAVGDPLAADRLEPEGDFGLPFGRNSSRNWAWGGVAVAAAVLISFYGRPERPGPASPTTLDRGLAAVRQAAPNLDVMNVNLTPNQVAALQRRLAIQSARQAQLPPELMAVSQRGVDLRPIDPAAARGDGEERLVYVDASRDEVDRLLAQLGDKSSQADDARAQPALQEGVSSKGPRAVRLHMQLKPGASLKVNLPPGAAIQAPAATDAGGKRRVLLRIRVNAVPAPSEN